MTRHPFNRISLRLTSSLVFAALCALAPGSGAEAAARTKIMCHVENSQTVETCYCPVQFRAVWEQEKVRKHPGIRHVTCVVNGGASVVVSVSPPSQQDANGWAAAVSLTVFYASEDGHGSTAAGGNLSAAGSGGNSAAGAGGGGEANASGHSVSASGGGQASACSGSSCK